MVARIYKALSHVGNLTQFGVLFSSFVIVMTSMKWKTFPGKQMKRYWTYPATRRLEDAWCSRTVLRFNRKHFLYSVTCLFVRPFTWMYFRVCVYICSMYSHLICLPVHVVLHRYGYMSLQGPHHIHQNNRSLRMHWKLDPVYAWICVCMHACLCVCVFVCTYVRMYVCTYVCMYACMNS